MNRGVEMGTFGYNDRNAENTKSGDWAGIIQEFRQQGSLMADRLNALSKDRQAALDQALNMEGYTPDALLKIPADDMEKLLPLLENLSLAQDKAAANKISKQIAETIS